MNAFYFLLDLAVWSAPLALSFDRRVAFYRSWRFVWPALLLNALFFIVWDVRFTATGVWGFNEHYLLGPSWAGLPLEEILFFLAIPYACLFLYETLRTYTTWNPSGAWIYRLTQVVSALFAAVAFLFRDQWYTATAFGLAAVFLAVLAALRVSWIGRFWIFYALQLIPFFLVNSALTGLFSAEPVVWYNDAHNLGIRIGTIPLEDFFYSMSMLGIPLALFEWLRVRAAKPVLTV